MQAKTRTKNSKECETKQMGGGGGGASGECSPGVPGPRGTAAPPQLLGRGKVSGGREGDSSAQSPRSEGHRQR